ncbi:hypothetical protein HYR99_30880 [Candidatus Poribacteria bacterium]|nr:hypothetical protein [Candidatus Poribacteria bacterium]
MTKLSLIAQMKQKADDLIALANALWEVCWDEHDAHCVIDADGNWHFTGPTGVLNDAIISEVIVKELEMLRANMDDWGFTHDCHPPISANQEGAFN